MLGKILNRERVCLFKDKRKSRHDIWTKKGSVRSIPVWGDEKEIPPQHLKTSCITIGCTLQDLYAWSEVNC
jgi:hypothetical protein